MALETAGGVMTKRIERNTTIPTKKGRVARVMPVHHTLLQEQAVEVPQWPNEFMEHSEGRSNGRIVLTSRDLQRGHWRLEHGKGHLDDWHVCLRWQLYSDIGK